ncbi:hypothetical protein BU26DRAFT_572163 [Trematosphaeria pertusa]|uniref:Uncharacterized protein n=1 Tax=Trematosphaeria pertusa TaxID=390896 RepID=A0A6A6HU20_9PLEO|nr:uncharacterized protein BU26DRAFT_572163 [Trematosphaeria pertusa]KAF2240920.1 hypothetical protein BU26DRAFT_572163 [Trematosphaeria pertusa]
MSIFSGANLGWFYSFASSMTGATINSSASTKSIGLAGAFSNTPRADMTVTVTVKKGYETGTLKLSPRVRSNSEILGKLPDGTVIHDASYEPMKAVVQHLDGDDDFDYILKTDSRTPLRIVQVWTLAGQLKLFNVQNRLIQAATEFYLRHWKRYQFVPDVEPFQFIYKTFGTLGESRIGLFIVTFYAGLAGPWFAADTPDMPYELRCQLVKMANAIQAMGMDFILMAWEQARVDNHKGDSRKAPDLKLEIPMADSCSEYGRGQLAIEDGNAYAASYASSNVSGCTAGSGASNLSKANIDKLQKLGKAPSAITSRIIAEINKAKRNGGAKSDASGHSRGSSHRSEGGNSGTSRNSATSSRGSSKANSFAFHCSRHSCRSESVNSGASKVSKASSKSKSSRTPSEMENELNKYARAGAVFANALPPGTRTAPRTVFDGGKSVAVSDSISQAHCGSVTSTNSKDGKTKKTLSELFGQ